MIFRIRHCDNIKNCCTEVNTSQQSSFVDIKIGVQKILKPLLLALFIHLGFILLLMVVNSQKQFQIKPNNIPKMPILIVALKSNPKPVLAEPEIDLVMRQIKRVTTAVDKQASKNELHQKIIIGPLPNQSQNTKLSKVDTDTNQTSRIMNGNLRNQILKHLQNNQDSAKEPALGKFTAHELPLNWTRKAVGYTPGMFKDAERKARINFSGAEIVDAWRGPDGSFNTKMRLRNGEMICSSKSQGDPFNNFSNSIWMFSRC